MFWNVWSVKFKGSIYLNPFKFPTDVDWSYLPSVCGLALFKCSTSCCVWHVFCIRNSTFPRLYRTDLVNWLEHFYSSGIHFKPDSKLTNLDTWEIRYIFLEYENKIIRMLQNSGYTISQIPVRTLLGQYFLLVPITNFYNSSFLLLFLLHITTFFYFSKCHFPE